MYTQHPILTEKNRNVNENHEVEGTAQGAQRQNCGKAQIWPRLQKNFCSTQGS